MKYFVTIMSVKWVKGTIVRVMKIYLISLYAVVVKGIKTLDVSQQAILLCEVPQPHMRIRFVIHITKFSSIYQSAPIIYH